MSDPTKLSRQQRRALERTRAKQYEQQPYVQLQRDVFAPFLEPGRVYLSDVYHDDWCPFLSGGFCECEPEIVMRRLAKDGSIEGETEQ